LNFLRFEVFSNFNIFTSKQFPDLNLFIFEHFLKFQHFLFFYNLNIFSKNFSSLNFFTKIENFQNLNKMKQKRHTCYWAKLHVTHSVEALQEAPRSCLQRVGNRSPLQSFFCFLSPLQSWDTAPRSSQAFWARWGSLL
jgi:hypothetical protein